MNIKHSFHHTFGLLKETFSQFMKDNSLKLSASLSYYTIFALPPLLIIIISLCGIFFGTEAVKGELFGQINGLIGNEGASQVQEMIKNVSLTKSNIWATIIGFVVLLMGASGIFGEIQSSINYIWGLEAKPKLGIMLYIKNRITSFSMVGSLGFLLLVSLLANSLMEILGDRIANYLPRATLYVLYLINVALVFGIITLLFMVIFRTLPDGKVSLKDTFIGAAFTAFFFILGKFAIGLYLGNSNVASTYGAAGSIVLILVWVYYSAIILYFGAEFTKVYTLSHGKKIIPNKYSVEIKKKTIEVEHRKPANA